MKKFEEKIDITYSMGIIRELSEIVDNELTGNRSSASDAERSTGQQIFLPWK